MHTKLNSRSSRPSLAWLPLCICFVPLFTATDALAYKVERVCEMTEPTAKKPATKVCKTLLVKPGAEKKAEKKEEKPAAGHH